MKHVVHHYFPHGSSNVGDTLVAHAIQKALVKHWGPCEFVNIAVNNRFAATRDNSGLHGKNIARSNAEANLVAVGGSNLLEPRKPSRHKNTPWQWGVQTDVESLLQLHVPVLMIGMGTGSDWGSPVRPYPTSAAEEIRLLRQNSVACAVRDELTRQKLADIGVEALCTGCPVTFLTDRPVEQTSPSKPLLVSLPPARILKTWSGRWFMWQTMNYIKWLRKQGIKFIATLHERADLDFAPQWLPRDVEQFYTEDVSELIERYEDSCGVIGFRLHAALLSLGLGKPIVPVNVDWRGRAFSHTYGLRHLALEPGTWGHFQRLRKLTLQLLEGEHSLISLLRMEKQRYQQRYHQFLKDAYTNFNQTIPLKAAG